MAQLNIYRLNRADQPTRDRGWAHAFVVIAATPEEARQLAANGLQEENGEVDLCDEYLEVSLTECTLIGHALEGASKGVVAADYDYEYNVAHYPWHKAS